MWGDIRCLQVKAHRRSSYFLTFLHVLRTPQVANSQRERLQRLGDVPVGPVKSTNGTFEHLISRSEERVFSPRTERFECMSLLTVLAVRRSGVLPEQIYKSLCAQEARDMYTVVSGDHSCAGLDAMRELLLAYLLR